VDACTGEGPNGGAAIFFLWRSSLSLLRSAAEREGKRKERGGRELPRDMLRGSIPSLPPGPVVVTRSQRWLCVRERRGTKEMESRVTGEEASSSFVPPKLKDDRPIRSDG
jgi:hypothetical protein